MARVIADTMEHITVIVYNTACVVEKLIHFANIAGMKNFRISTKIAEMCDTIFLYHPVYL
jgi:hypothetical protein